MRLKRLTTSIMRTKCCLRTRKQNWNRMSLLFPTTTFSYRYKTLPVKTIMYDFYCVHGWLKPSLTAYHWILWCSLGFSLGQLVFLYSDCQGEGLQTAAVWLYKESTKTNNKGKQWLSCSVTRVIKQGHAGIQVANSGRKWQTSSQFLICSNQNNHT